MENNLPLAEKLFLLSIKPRNGGLIGNGVYYVQFGFIATLIKELEESGNIIIRGKRVEVKSFENNDPLHAYILSKFKKYSKPLKLTRWFSRLYYSLKYITNELKSRLLKKRLIRVEQRKFIFILYKKSCLTEKALVREMVDKIRSQLYSSNISPEWGFILSVIEPAGLMNRLFPVRQQRNSAKRRLKQLNLENEISSALKKSIDSMRAATGIY